MVKLFGKLAAFGLGGFISLQLVRPSIPEKPAEAELEAPTAVKHVFEKDCYSCHFILGNDVATRAARFGQLSPWPDGVKSAKIA